LQQRNDLFISPYLIRLEIVLPSIKLQIMNWPVLIVTGMALIALLVFLIRRNFKDERKFEKQLKNDYRKTKDEEGDIVTDEELK